MSTTPFIIVIDLDGTLFDVRHREHLAQAGQWDDFHDLLGDDRPKRDVAGLINLVGDQATLVACTGRNESYRNQTLTKLASHGFSFDVLLMRPDGNFQRDDELNTKLLEDWLELEGLQKEDVLFILEDRDKVVQSWRDGGYNCWQVQDGAY